MGKKGLSVPSVIVNNETWQIIPGSLTYDGGEHEVNVRNVSSGGQGNESVHTENAEEAVSNVTFKTATMSDTDDRIAELKGMTAEISIQFVERVGDTNEKRSFSGMSLTNKPERSTGADGETEFVFQGDPMA